MNQSTSFINRPTSQQSESFSTGTKPPGVRLTKTEIEVLELIAQGLSSQEAADKRVCSKRTIDFHLANAYGKLMVNNRVQAIRAAHSLGFLPFEPNAIFFD